jgi:dCTP diphosphatase
MPDIQKLTEKVVAFRDARDWKQFHNPKDLSISLLLEATEVLEHFQWKNKEEMDAYVVSNKEDIAEELADVMYWVLLLANDLHVDLADAFEKKLEKNAKKYPIEKSAGNHKKYTEI